MTVSRKRKIGGVIFTTGVLILMGIALTPALLSVPQRNDGYGYGYGYCSPGTPGYWRNHPEAWPVDEITIGGVVYSKSDAIDLIFAPGRGDKTYSLFEHLVAARLNVMKGCDDTCVADTITAADNWLIAHPLDSGIRGNSEWWKDPGQGEDLKDILDDYNNGRLCY